VRSAAAAASLLSSSSAIDAALRAHHNRKLFENPYVAGKGCFEAQAVSNKLTNGIGEKKGSKLMRSLYAAFYGGYITTTARPERFFKINRANLPFIFSK
jgi:hypothetical protein